MEIREISGLFVSVYTDDMMPYSYVRILTDSTLLTVKLPSRFRDSKFAHYCTPYNILTLEIIKTRKNWIVRDITVNRTIVEKPTFSHILKHSQMLKLLSQNITEGQNVDILEWFVAQIKGASSEIGMDDFQKQLDQKLNFKMA
jgi:hypothetical protein